MSLIIFSGFLQNKYGFAPEQAGYSIGIIVLVSMIFSPIVGKLLDVFGKRTHASKSLQDGILLILHSYCS